MFSKLFMRAMSKGVLALLDLIAESLGRGAKGALPLVHHFYPCVLLVLHQSSHHSAHMLRLITLPVPSSSASTTPADLHSWLAPPTQPQTNLEYKADVYLLLI